MANGSILSELKRKIDNNETIPQNVTNGLILTALTELYAGVEDIKKDIRSLQDCLNKDSLLDKEKEERLVTWPYLWENFGRDIVKYLIVVILAYVLFRAGIIH